MVSRIPLVSEAPTPARRDTGSEESGLFLGELDRPQLPHAEGSPRGPPSARPTTQRRATARVASHEESRARILDTALFQSHESELADTSPQHARERTRQARVLRDLARRSGVRADRAERVRTPLQDVTPSCASFPIQLRTRRSQSLADRDDPVPEAVLGARIEVPTLDGRVELAVPPGTQPGAVLLFRGKGLPRLGGGRRAFESTSGFRSRHPRRSESCTSG